MAGGWKFEDGGLNYTAFFTVLKLPSSRS